MAEHPSSHTASHPATPFHDLDSYVALPRLSGLAMSPDGTRLVTTVATPNATGTAYASALWEVDPHGGRPAHRLTRSSEGESGAAFTGSGDLYFTSSRPDPDAAKDAPSDVKALWLLSRAGGEGRPVVVRRGGVGAVRTARDADAVLISASALPGADDEDADDVLRKARAEHEVKAILHAGYPVRFWDADLGPGADRMYAVEGPTEDEGMAELRLLTPDSGRALDRAEWTVSPDGTWFLTSWQTPRPRGDVRSAVARVDVATGQRRIVAADDARDYEPGPISPDGSRAILAQSTVATPDTAPRRSLAVLDVEAGTVSDLAPEWDRWASPMDWLPDGSAVLVVADQDGRSPVFSVDVASGAVTQVTHDDASYTDVSVAPDGGAAYALRSSYAFPSEVVRIDLRSGDVTRLPGPAERPELPGRLEETEAAAADGTRVRAWLALPEDSAADHPAPLLLWIHGGPLSSWNAWSWRWNPWLMVAQGYAVLLPDPALSTGYGQDFVQRGWGRWGAEPFTDLMAITDAVVARPDIDDGHTAAMGGSFGGYMANWVAGHTDRFDAIVTHASLWALDQFGPTTDMASYWAKEMTPQMAAANSPHQAVGDITTPMLVIHGDRDYRVPIGEGLRLWWELLSASGLPADADGETVHRFLYFPNENHWVLTPQHATVWYRVVSHFLATHLGRDVPPLPADLGLTPPDPT